MTAPIVDAPPVVDEFLERYRQVAHIRLYRQLMDGSPDEVERTAVAWRTAAATLSTIAVKLRNALAELAKHWEGDTSAIYQNRMERVQLRADELAGEADVLHTGLSIMATMLATSQHDAESAPPEDGEWAFDGLLGPAFGRFVPGHVRTRLHESLAALVADLAAQYAMTEHKIWYGPRLDPTPDSPQPEPTVAVGMNAPEAVTGSTHLTSNPSPTSPTSPASSPPHTPTSPATVSTLAGAARSLVPAEAGHLIASAGGGGGTGAPTGPMPMAPVMGNMAPVQNGEVGGLGRVRWREDQLAWSTHDRNVGGTDEPPHPILGDPEHRA